MKSILTHLQIIACPEIRRRAVSSCHVDSYDTTVNTLVIAFWAGVDMLSSPEGQPFWNAFLDNPTLTFDDLKHLIKGEVVTDGWISVKDRLPKKDGNSEIPCLVFVLRYGIAVHPYNEHHKCWDDSDGDDYFTDAVGGKITHWQPLPPAPQNNSTD